jgi:hypothetical protein
MKERSQAYNKLFDAESGLKFIKYAVMNDEVYNLHVRAESYLEAVISLIKDAQEIIKNNDPRRF